VSLLCLVYVRHWWSSQAHRFPGQTQGGRSSSARTIVARSCKAEERKKVKATARELSKTMKEAKLVLDWRKRHKSRAGVWVTIEKLLDQGLPKMYTLRCLSTRPVSCSSTSMKPTMALDAVRMGRSKEAP
jgi:hypothetical protein